MPNSPDAMPNEPGAEDLELELDAWSATNAEEFAALLRKLRVQYGEPSLQELEDRSLRSVPGRRTIPLSRATISAVLNGRRLAGHDFLISFLDALGVPVPDQQPWLATRAQIAEDRMQADDEARLNSVETGYEPVHEGPATVFPGLPAPHYPEDVEEPVGAPLFTQQSPYQHPAPPRGRHRARWMLAVVVLVAALGVGTAIYVSSQGTPATSTLNCVPPTCAAAAPRLILRGHLSGDVPGDQQPVLLTQADQSGQWYLGQNLNALDNGEWATDIDLDGLAPALTSRHFRICVYLVPETSIARLSRLMSSSSGNGLTAASLPGDRTELVCKAASRVKNS